MLRFSTRPTSLEGAGGDCRPAAPPQQTEQLGGQLGGMGEEDRLAPAPAGLRMGFGSIIPYLPVPLRPTAGAGGGSVWMLSEDGGGAGAGVLSAESRKAQSCSFTCHSAAREERERERRRPTVMPQVEGREGRGELTACGSEPWRGGLCVNSLQKGRRSMVVGALTRVVSLWLSVPSRRNLQRGPEAAVKASSGKE